jgi:hypothetical protein
VYDITDPANLVQKDTVGVGTNPAGMYLQGRYLYVACNGASTIEIVDVESPNALYSLGSFSTGASSNPTSVWVSGNVLYVTLNGTGKLGIYNISNDLVTRHVLGAYVLTPTSYTAVTTSSGTYGLFVAGRYAYVTNYSGNTMQIIDVKSPASASVTATYSTGASSGPAGVYVQGRYAYLTTNTTSTLQIVDVSNPASPAQVGSNISTGASSSPLFGLVVQGRYAYVATTGTGDALQIYDMGGVYAQQLEAGGIETGTLRVNGDTSLGGELNVQGGASIGHGLNVAGDISANGQVRLQGKNDSDQALQILDTSGWALLTASTDDARIGIGTDTPDARLTIDTGGVSVTQGVSLYSGASGAYTTYTIGRTAVDGTLAVAANSGNFASGAAAGDIILRAESSSNKVFLGAGGTASLVVSNTSTDVNGTLQINIGSTASTFALCHATNGAQVDQTITDCNGSATDYAEDYATTHDVDYGDIVSVGSRAVRVKAVDSNGAPLNDGTMVDDRELIKAATPYDSKAIGIVSNNYSDFTSTGHGRIDPADHPMPVALNGRVPVKIAATSAIIHAGDFVTTSDVAGRAMKATKAGQVIGKALEDWTPGSDKDQILVFVNISWQDPDLMLSNTEDISLFINGAEPTSGNASYGVKDASGQDVTRVGVFSEGVVGKLQAGNISAQSLSLGGSAQVGGAMNVSGPATLASLTVTGMTSLADLHVTGSTVVADITVNGHITTGGTTPTVASGAAACIAPTVTVTGNDTSGTLTIVAGAGCSAGGVLANVTFAKPYLAAPRVLLTPVGDDSTDLKYNIGTTSATGFEVKTKNAPTAAITYTYYYHVEQ